MLWPNKPDENRTTSGPGRELTQFKPGNLANPSGRPKGSKDSVVATYRRLLKKRPDKEVLRIMEARGIDIQGDITNADALSYATLTSALAGEGWAEKALRESDDSKSPASSSNQSVVFNIIAVQSKNEEQPPIMVNGVPVNNGNSNKHTTT